jgi:hypothetical protein
MAAGLQTANTAYMGESEVQCSHCRQAIARGERAVALDGGEPRAFTFAGGAVSGDCYHATCFQIARVQRAIDELGDDVR